MKKRIIILGICIFLFGIPSTTAIFNQSIRNPTTQIIDNIEFVLRKDTPPEWASHGFVGFVGITDQVGRPMQPSHAIIGYCQDNFKGRFAGIIAELEEKEPRGYLVGRIIGPFMLGLAANLTNEKHTFVVGLGGSNETHFYFRTMAFVGPTFYVAGKYSLL